MRHSCITVTTGEVGIVTPLEAGWNSKNTYAKWVENNGKYSLGGSGEQWYLFPKRVQKDSPAGGYLASGSPVKRGHSPAKSYVCNAHYKRLGRGKLSPPAQASPIAEEGI